MNGEIPISLGLAIIAIAILAAQQMPHPDLFFQVFLRSRFFRYRPTGINNKKAKKANIMAAMIAAL